MIGCACSCSATCRHQGQAGTEVANARSHRQPPSSPMSIHSRTQRPGAHQIHHLPRNLTLQFSPSPLFSRQVSSRMPDSRFFCGSSCQSRKCLLHPLPLLISEDVLLQLLEFRASSWSTFCLLLSCQAAWAVELTQPTSLSARPHPAFLPSEHS